MKSLPLTWLLAAALGAGGLGLALAADAPAYLIVQDSWLHRIDGPGLELDHARVQLRRGRPRQAGGAVESEWTRARGTVHAALDDLSLRLGLPHVG